MASKNIKGITIEIDGDTTGLSDALKDVDKQSRRTTGELKQIDNALKFNPGNVELLAQQQELLAEQVNTTTQRLNTLREAQAQVQAQFQRGEINAEQYRAFQREIVTTESRLEHFQDRLEENARVQVDYSQLGRLKTALNETADVAKKAGAEIGRGISTGASAATAAIGGLVLGTQELNGDLARLRTNADIAGVGLEEAENAFQRLYQISGEADSSVEAVSQLLAAGFKGEQLSVALDNVAGAAIRFSDTLNVEGISDGLQETLALGEATGQFAELLDRSQVPLDTFNEKLSGIKDESGRLNFALETLNGIGLTETTERFAELNPEVAANQAATANLQLALSDLSIVLTPLVTLVSELITRFVEWASANPQLVTTFALVTAGITALSGVFAVLSPIVSALVAIFPALSAVIGAISAPIALAVGAIALIGTALVTAYTQSETFRNGVSSVFGAVKDFLVSTFTNIADFVSEKIAYIKDFWSENGSQIQQAFEKVSNAILKVIETVFPVIQDIITGVIDAVKNVVNGGLDFILGIVKTFSSALTGDWEDVWEGVKQMASGAIEAIWGVLQLGFAGKIIKVVQKFAGDAIKFVTDMWSKVSGKFDEMVSGATTKFNALKEAILKPIQTAKDTISKIVSDIKGFFSGLKLEIPPIKLPSLPKPKITGKFSLDPPSVPKISWNALGGIFTKPTVLQTNAGLQGFGEAGNEAIIPLKPDVLAGIGKGIAEQMNVGMPSTIVVQSVLDGRVVAETITPFVSQNQQSTTNLRAMSRGVQL